jgi:hypothetical protein
VHKTVASRNVSSLHSNEPVLFREGFNDDVLIQDFLRTCPGVELYTDGSFFHTSGINFAPLHHLYTVEGGADPISLRQDFHVHPFMLAGDSLCGGSVNTQALRIVVVPHAWIRKHHQGAARVPLVIAALDDVAPESNTGMVVRFHHLGRQREAEIGIVVFGEEE